MSQDPYSVPGEQQVAAPYVPQPSQPTFQSFQQEPEQPVAAQQTPGEVTYDKNLASYPVAETPTGSDAPTRYDEKNWLGIAALITAFVLPPLGIVFGWLGMRAVKDDQANNRGFALGGMTLGIAFTFFGVLWFVLMFAFAASAPDI